MGASRLLALNNVSNCCGATIDVSVPDDTDPKSDRPVDALEEPVTFLAFTSLRGARSVFFRPFRDRSVTDSSFLLSQGNVSRTEFTYPKDSSTASEQEA